MRPRLIKPIEIALPENDQKSEPLKIDITKTPFVDFGEALFGTPLKLSWYEICLFNNNEVSINETKVQLPYEKDPEAGAMEIKINYEDGTSNKIYAPVNTKTCNQFKIEKTIAGMTAEFRRPSSISFDPVLKVLQSDEKGGVAEVHQSTYVHTDRSYFSLRNRWDESIYKLLFLFLGV